MMIPSATSDLKTRIIGYWNMRAPGYSLATRLALKQDVHIIDTIGRIVNLDQRMKIADMGTGAGLMAIWLAEMGHDVVGLDLSERMIDLARRNSKDLGLSIEFRVEDVKDPSIPRASLDMIIAKSVIWCTEDPVGVYSKWMELLRPGGHLVIIDGNHYLDIFDEDYRRRKEYLDRKNGADNNLHAKTNIDGVDLNIIRDLAQELPLPKVRRPTWDVSTLLGLGMTDIRVRSLDTYSYSVLTENGFMKLPHSFMVVARKPFDDLSPYEEEMFRRPVDDSMLEHVRESIRDSWTGELAVIKALSDRTRLDIIHSLYSGRMSVSQIAITVGASQSMVSHALRVLKDSGLVESSREGKEVKYSLTNPHTVRSAINMLGDIDRRSKRSANHSLYAEADPCVRHSDAGHIVWAQGGEDLQSAPPWTEIQGSSLLGSLGKRMASLMLGRSSIFTRSLSMPIPHPPWGGMPYLKASR